MGASTIEGIGAGTGTGVDRELALLRVGGDAELLKEIAVLFLDDYPKLLVELHAAAGRGDAKTVERAAHSLKGSVSNFGAHAVVEAAWTLESMGRAQQLAAFDLTIQTLEQALRALRPELEAL
jgi:two-component system, sensor histidine kinase and response regulator